MLATLARGGFALVGYGLPHLRHRLLGLGRRAATPELARGLALAALGVGCDLRCLAMPYGFGEAKLGLPFADELLNLLG
jgi:hypothetical protein